MKSIFLLTFCVRDGESEYTLCKVVFVSTEKQATELALKYAEEFFCTDTVRDEENANLFWTDDGKRAVELEEVVKGTTCDLVERLLIE